MLKTLAALAAAITVMIFLLRLAFPLPDLPPSPGETRSFDPSDTELGRLVAPLAARNQGKSGVLALEQGTDAFAARILLIRSASETIDAQYYIWQNDLTGIRMLWELQEAARRGVRVRLLVDDNGTPELDQELAALDALPTAEVRFFNPFTLRQNRVLNYAFDFFRLNRRMHNKSLSIDRTATIVGGRNIGDIYFEAGSEQSYIDLDVLAVGPIAEEVSEDFERYWSSPSAYSASSLVELEPGADERLDERDAAVRDTAQARAYSQVVLTSPLIDELKTGQVPFEWVRTLLFSDDPTKVLRDVDEDDLMVRRLFEEIGTPKSSFDIISAYFITGEQAAQRLVQYASSGARVRTLTNSLEATDVVIVHAGYVRYRSELLAGGVEVYELGSESADSRKVNEFGVVELSKAALHAKIFAVDRRRAFVGSLNFDPRSRRLNTEMGILIDSSTLSARISDWLDESLPKLAYRVTLDDNGRTHWSRQNADGSVTDYDVEPKTTWPLRSLVLIASKLPIQWML